MLVLTNVLPLAGALLLLARLIDRFGTTDWGRLLAVAAACFATFMTTFAATLNNHLTAAISLVVGLAAIMPIVADGRREIWRFALAGLSLGFLAANELPALSLLALAGAYLLWKAPSPTLLALAPAALVVAAAAFGTNILAHGDWRTPYAHRKDGPVIATLSSIQSALEVGKDIVPRELLEKLREQGIELSGEARVEEWSWTERWKVSDPSTGNDFVLINVRKPDVSFEVRRWENWYDYKDSYWLKRNLRGIDRGEQSPLVYAFHVLVGHHGLFSLTPLWLLSAAGCWFWLFPGSGRREPPDNAVDASRLIAATTILITVVVLAFYLTRPQIDRNYGGGTCCLRWLLWLTPLWILTLLPAVDRLSHIRWGRGIALALLLISVLSANYAADNPWSHPWLFEYWTSIGWIKY